jgi:hypothetical protein
LVAHFMLGRRFDSAQVVTDELCTTVMASSPTMSPMNGFSVAAKKPSSRSPPSSSKPSPGPLMPSRKT